jgi:hypothetical protein
MDLNFETLEVLTKCLRKKLDYNSSTEYLQDVDTKLIKDFRFLDGKR